MCILCFSVCEVLREAIIHTFLHCGNSCMFVFHTVVVGVVVVVDVVVAFERDSRCMNACGRTHTGGIYDSLVSMIYACARCRIKMPAILWRRPRVRWTWWYTIERSEYNEEAEPDGKTGASIKISKCVYFIMARYGSRMRLIGAQSTRSIDGGCIRVFFDHPA